MPTLNFYEFGTLKNIKKELAFTIVQIFIKEMFLMYSHPSGMLP